MTSEIRTKGVNEADLWGRVERRITTRLDEFDGIASVFVRDLQGGRDLAINADCVLPSASTIKIFILAHLLEKRANGSLDWDRVVTVDQSIHVPGSGVLAYFDNPLKLTVGDIAMLMILVSDNTATNMCIDWATYDGVNEMVKRIGLNHVMLRRKMQDHLSVLRGDENVASARDVVAFLTMLECGEGLPHDVCAETLRIMKKKKHGYMSPALPDDLEIANKPGGMDQVRNDAGIVYLPRRPYALCIMTAYGFGDRRLGEMVIGDVARTVHTYMTMLDHSSPWGQGVPQTVLDRAR